MGCMGKNKTIILVRELPAFGCAVWVEHNTLCEMELNTFRNHGIHCDCDWEYGGECTHPESQVFLDYVNEALRTDFQLSEFFDAIHH